LDVKAPADLPDPIFHMRESNAFRVSALDFEA
jgi:hypothetical protein